MHGGGGAGQAGIHDETQTNLVNLRRTIYLTLMSALDFEEAGHKLLKMVRGWGGAVGGGVGGWRPVALARVHVGWAVVLAVAVVVLAAGLSAARPPAPQPTHPSAPNTHTPPHHHRGSPRARRWSWPR